VIDVMGNVTPRSPVDATLRGVETFLRVVRDGSSGAGPRQPAGDAVATQASLATERQMVLPHVPIDAPGGARLAAAAAADTLVEKTIWGSPAGKKHLAPRLVKLIPPHRTYVEPFAGSGAVFFAKPPSDKEVLSDADPEIAFAYKALSTLSDGELAALKKKDWTGRRTLFHAMREAAPRSRVDKLYRFLYLSHFAYGKLRGKSYNPNAEGVPARTIARIEKFRDRLRNATVRSGHYADVVKEFDGKNTFFFLDPPYPGHNVEVGEDRFDETEFRKVLDRIKGKFLVTYGTRGKLETIGFHVRTIRTRRTISSMRGVGGPKTLPQVLISNYAIAKKALGPYELEEVEAGVYLAPDLAADLDLMHVLAKALAEEAGEPSIVALAAELDRFEGSGDERTSVLARAILSPSLRVAPAIEKAIPDVGAALRAAVPAIAELAKTASARDAAVASPRSKDRISQLIDAALEKRIPVFKTDEERFVLGVVLEPETVDAQDDIYSAAEVRDAAHRFMEQYQNIGLMHQGLVNGRVKILESYLAPTSFSLDGAQVKKGTWLLAVRVLDEELWAQIKNGDLTGLSIGGSAARSAERDDTPTSG
jgi:site-specific DNA-adenine methylase